MLVNLTALLKYKRELGNSFMPAETATITAAE